MKYMNFNNSCFFTALANLLEDFDIDVEDKDVIRDTYIPYMFRYHQETKTYVSGYQIQDKPYLNEYLKQYILEFDEEVFTHDCEYIRKYQLIQSLKKDSKRKIISIQVNETYHAVIVNSYKKGQFHLINIRRENDGTSDFYFTEEEIISKLNPNTRYGYIKRNTNFIVLDKDELFNSSLSCLQNYRRNLLGFIMKQSTQKERLNTKNSLFKALLLNYKDIAYILGETKLHNDLSTLLNQYIDTFNIVECISLSDYIDTSLLEESLDTIKDIIQNRQPRTYYHGSKVSNLKRLEPNTAIHDKKNVYLTTNKVVALMYTVNAIEAHFKLSNYKQPKSYKQWYSYGFDKGKLHIDEYYPNAFFETYKNQSGYLYLCESPAKVTNPTNIFCAYTSEVSVKSIQEIKVDDIYDTFLEYEKAGLLEIRYYHQMNPLVLKGIKNQIKQEIKNLDLINKPNDHYTVFLKDKFPELF